MLAISATILDISAVEMCMTLTLTFRLGQDHIFLFEGNSNVEPV